MKRFLAAAVTVMTMTMATSAMAAGHRHSVDVFKDVMVCTEHRGDSRTNRLFLENEAECRVEKLFPEQAKAAESFPTDLEMQKWRVWGQLIEDVNSKTVGGEYTGNYMDTNKVPKNVMGFAFGMDVDKLPDTIVEQKPRSAKVGWDFTKVDAEVEHYVRRSADWGMAHVHRASSGEMDDISQVKNVDPAKAEAKNEGSGFGKLLGMLGHAKSNKNSVEAEGLTSELFGIKIKGIDYVFDYNYKLKGMVAEIATRKDFSLEKDTQLISDVLHVLKEQLGKPTVSYRIKATNAQTATQEVRVWLSKDGVKVTAICKEFFGSNAKGECEHGTIRIEKLLSPEEAAKAAAAAGKEYKKKNTIADFND